METRWYRAPEALCSWNSYTAGIDIWSTGCTFAEMMSGKPLFPGQSKWHQLRLIADILGTDTLGTDIVDILKHIANEKCARFLETLDETPKCDFMEIFPSATEEALEMFFGMVEVPGLLREAYSNLGSVQIIFKCIVCQLCKEFFRMRISHNLA